MVVYADRYTPSIEEVYVINREYETEFDAIRREIINAKGVQPQNNKSDEQENSPDSITIGRVFVFSFPLRQDDSLESSQSTARIPKIRVGLQPIPLPPDDFSSEEVTILYSMYSSNQSSFLIAALLSSPGNPFQSSCFTIKSCIPIFSIKSPRLLSYCFFDIALRSRKRSRVCFCLRNSAFFFSPGSWVLRNVHSYYIFSCRTFSQKKNRSPKAKTHR